MRIIKYISFLIVLGLATACAPYVNVSTDYDHAVNFQQYRSFNWYSSKAVTKQDTLQYDTFFDKRMQNAIKANLSQRGVEFAAKPDIYINYNVSFANQTTTNSGPFYPYGYYGGYNRFNNSNQYKEGTIIVDLIDARNNQLLWRGVGESEVRSRNIPEDKVIEIVNSILSKFPPKR